MGEGIDDIGQGRQSRWFALPALIGAAIILAIGVLVAVTQLREPYQSDFLSYWAAARLALNGTAAAAYDIDLHRAVQATAVDMNGDMPFPYPPFVLMLLMPLGLMLYVPGFLLWVGGSAVAFVAAMRRFDARTIWLAIGFPPVMINMIIGQNGLVTGALFAGFAVMLARGRPFVAGLLLGCLVIKPHLGLAIPIVLAVAREWRMFAGAAASVLSLLAGGLILFPLDVWSAWLAQAPLYASIVADGLVPWYKMASVYAGLRVIGLPSEIAWALHIAIAVGAVGVCCMIWRCDVRAGARAAALAATMMLVSPYLYIYDEVILALPFAWLVLSGRHQAVLGLCWIGFFMISMIDLGFPISLPLAPFITMCLLWLTWCESRAAWRSPALALSPAPSR